MYTFIVMGAKYQEMEFKTSFSHLFPPAITVTGNKQCLLELAAVVGFK